MVKTETQYRKEYEKKQEKIFDSFQKRIDKAREVQTKASKKVNQLEYKFVEAQKKAREKYYKAKRKRSNQRKKN